MRPSSPAVPVRFRRAAAAAAVLVVAGVAVAGTVTHTTSTQFATGTEINISTSNGEIKLATLVNQVDEWYRHPWDDATWEAQAQHDDGIVFADGDRCLRSIDNGAYLVDTIDIGGFEFRTGPDDVRFNGKDYLSTVPTASPVVLPTGMATVDAVRFVTGGARISQQSYTVTFHYSDATSSAVSVPIKIDTTTGAARDAVGVNYVVDGVTGFTHRVDNGIDGDANGTSDCAGSGADVVEVTNPNPTKTVLDVEFTYPEYPASGTVTGWLGGPIAVTLVTDEPEIENTFTYRGELISALTTSSAVDAGSNARWFKVTWNPVVATGSEVLLHLRCANDGNANLTLDATELSTEQTYSLSSLTSPYTLPVVCVGRYLAYRVEIVDEFSDTPKITDFVFEYDPDADSDGFGASGTAGTLADCNDNNALVKPGGVETAGDGVDSNCDNLEVCYQDTDNDLFRTNLLTTANDADCNDSGEALVTEPATDCNDNNNAIKPGAVETVGDGVDYDCNSQEICYADADNDGNRHASNTVPSPDVDCADANEGTAADLVDCDDNDAQRFIGNTEITGNEKDEDCNGQERCWADLDNDDTRSASGTVTSSDFDCDDLTEQVTAAAIDCDDNDNTQYPGNVETTGNGVDNDCLNGEICWLDADDDGYRSTTLTKTSTDEDCTDATEALTGDGIDCDETRATVHPGALDVCGNGLDDNCNGAGDHGFPNFLDDDGDGLLYATESSILTSDCDADSDNDNLTDDDEYLLSGTSPIDADSDDDLMNDNTEVGANPSAPVNTDGDALIDALDPDDDNDGLLSRLEDWDADGNPRDDDNDGDGIKNVLDTDDDGDGVPTDTEDVNNNGIYSDDNIDLDSLPDWVDNDDDNDGILTANEDVNNNGNRLDDNTDLDTLPNYRDADDDGDTVLTVNENVNGLSDARDDDTDADGIPNYRDTNDDNDGILTSLEYSDAPGRNVDADSLENHLDLDSDGDGYTDATEGRVASDADGIYDYLDVDSDGDTVLDASEVVEDFDLDGLTNRVDNDDDNDGITTAQEQSDPAGGDGDGFPNYRDADSDGDNWPDAYEWTVIRTSTDDDGDGKKNYVDTDSDGDTLLDRDELGTSTAPVNSDGDPWQNRIDSDDDGDCVLTKDEIGNPTPGMHDNFDGDALVNYLDTDDDNDLEPSCTEDPDLDGNPADDDTDGDGQPNFVDDEDDGDQILTQIENSLPAGRDVDGDGLINSIDPDSDGDGWDDDDEATAGVLINSDGDANPDFVDTDSENDLVPDSREGSTTNHRDTDLDGLLDRIDWDDDDDQIPTDEECSTSCANNQPWDDDFDGDGIADYIDFDDDNDGVSTYDEDVDENGDPRDDESELTPDNKPDYLDTDDDNDGILTIFEDVNYDGQPLNDNTDGDLRPNYRDYDDDEDLLFTITETEQHDFGTGTNDPRDYDFDGDRWPNYLDADDDDDLVDTYCEIYTGLGTHLEVDADGDTILDGIEWYNFLATDDDVDPNDALDFGGSQTGLACESPWDRDSDGTPNLLDADDDNDGLSTGLDETGTDIDCQSGTAVPSGDHIPDYLDQDSDNDGILDGVQEGLGDADGDFVVDFLDCDESGCLGDSDEDGIKNCDEEETLCGVLPSTHRPCATDPDYDGDGVVDGIEVGGDIFSPKDSDGDNIPDFIDPDDDGDQLASHWENGIDGCRLLDDGTPDLQDRYHCYVEDCSTGGYWFFECVPASSTTTDTLTFDFGGNELSDYPNLDQADGALPLYPDTTPNVLDTDDDGDGKLSIDEGMADDDSDGLPNAYDPYDHDGPTADPDGDGLLTEIEIGLGTEPYDSDTDDDGLDDGFEVGDPGAPNDHDDDGTIDASDPDDDNDGVPTVLEGTTDPDADGVPSYLDDDSDGDGKLDRDEDPTADADCDGLWDPLDAADADGPCLNGDGPPPEGVYVNQGCQCSSGGAGAPWAGLVLGALLVAGRRRRT